MAVEAPLGTRVVTAAALLVALAMANATSLQVFVVAFVAVAATWVWDLAANAQARGVRVNIWVGLFAVVAPAWAAYRWGFEGFGFSAAVVVAVSLAWGLVRPEHRSLEGIAATLATALLVGAGAAPIVLIRMRDSQEVGAFLFVVVVSVVATWVASLFEHRLGFIDPSAAALGGALVAGAIAGAVWGETWSGIFVASVIAAAGIVAARALGSLLRSGEIVLSETAPGMLALLDGPLAAAGLFWVALELFA
jgi:hypothetical protein